MVISDLRLSKREQHGRMSLTERLGLDSLVILPQRQLEDGVGNKIFPDCLLPPR